MYVCCTCMILITVHTPWKDCCFCYTAYTHSLPSINDIIKESLKVDEGENMKVRFNDVLMWINDSNSSLVPQLSTFIVIERLVDST